MYQSSDPLSLKGFQSQNANKINIFFLSLSLRNLLDNAHHEYIIYPSSEDISAIRNRRTSSSPFGKRIRLLLLNGNKSCRILMMLLPTGHHQRLTSLIESRRRRWLITICHLCLLLLELLKSRSSFGNVVGKPTQYKEETKIKDTTIQLGIRRVDWLVFRVSTTSSQQYRRRDCIYLQWSMLALAQCRDARWCDLSGFTNRAISQQHQTNYDPQHHCQFLKKYFNSQTRNI